MNEELLKRVKIILEGNAGEKRIDLSNEGLTDKDIEEVVKLLKCDKKIKLLNLYRNNIGDKGAKLLATLTNVHEIDLSANRIKDEGAKALICSDEIKELNLSDNAISNNCAAFIIENVKQTYLCLEQNKLQRDNLSRIEEALQRNRQNAKKTVVRTNAWGENAQPHSLSMYGVPIPRSPTSKIPEEIGELFDGAFELLFETLNELSDPSDKNILLHLLKKEDMQISERCAIARLIDTQLGSSFDVLCAAIQNKWDDAEVASHKKALIENMAKHGLPNDAPQAEFETVVQELKNRAHIKVVHFIKLQNSRELSEDETAKLHALTTNTLTQEKTPPLIEEYLKEAEEDEFKFKPLIFFKDKETETKENDKGFIAKISENYSVANVSWKPIYELIGKTPTGRPRDASRTCNILKAILYKEAKGISWRDLPQKFPPYTTVYYYYRQWSNILPKIRFLLLNEPFNVRFSSGPVNVKQPTENLGLTKK